MPNAKIKIAVTLAGQLRYWDLCSAFFKEYNSINPSIQYDFFLSTWDDQDAIKTYDFSFLKAYEIISPNLLKKRKEDYVSYPFLLNRVNNLKNFYLSEHGVDYDCVISTRPDIFILPELLNVVSDNVVNNKFTPNKLYMQDIIKERYNSSNNPSLNDSYFTMLDYYVIGHKNAVDIHANIFNDMYIEKKQKNFGVHITPADHLVNNKIISHPMVGFAGLVRYTHIQMLTDIINSKTIYEIYRNNSIPKDFLYQFNTLSRKYPIDNISERIKINSLNSNKKVLY